MNNPISVDPRIVRDHLDALDPVQARVRRARDLVVSLLDRLVRRETIYQRVRERIACDRGERRTTCPHPPRRCWSCVRCEVVSRSAMVQAKSDFDVARDALVQTMIEQEKFSR